MHCPKCRKLVKAEDGFCVHCGEALTFTEQEKHQEKSMGLKKAIIIAAGVIVCAAVFVAARATIFRSPKFLVVNWNSTIGETVEDIIEKLEKDNIPYKSYAPDAAILVYDDPFFNLKDTCMLLYFNSSRGTDKMDAIYFQLLRASTGSAVDYSTEDYNNVVQQISKIYGKPDRVGQEPIWRLRDKNIEVERYSAGTITVVVTPSN